MDVCFSNDENFDTVQKPLKKCVRCGRGVWKPPQANSIVLVSCVHGLIDFVLFPIRRSVEQKSIQIIMQVLAVVACYGWVSNIHNISTKQQSARGTVLYNVQQYIGTQLSHEQCIYTGCPAGIYTQRGISRASIEILEQCCFFYEHPWTMAILFSTVW